MFGMTFKLVSIKKTGERITIRRCAPCTLFLKMPFELGDPHFEPPNFIKESLVLLAIFAMSSHITPPVKNAAPLARPS